LQLIIHHVAKRAVGIVTGFMEVASRTTAVKGLLNAVVFFKLQIGDSCKISDVRCSDI